jgi:hypothetical protein
MHNRPIPHLTSTMLWLLVAIASFLVWGCAIDTNNPAGAGGSANVSGTTASSPYPPLNEQMLRDGPAPGVHFFQPPVPEMDDHWCDSLTQSRLCRDEFSSTVGFPFVVTVRVPDGALAHDEVITVVMPLSCYAIADFYPHPYQFQDQIEIHWMVGNFGLPRDYDYSRLIPFYVNDAGDYIEMSHQWLNGHRELVVFTNHFSRYIIGQRAG